MKGNENVKALGLMLAISDLRIEIVNRCINAAEEWHARVYTRDKGARQSLMAAVAKAGERGLSNFDLKQTAYAAFFQERTRADREKKTDLCGCAISASGQVVPAPPPDGRFDRLTRALDDLVRAGGSAEAVIDEMRTLIVLSGVGGWISVKDRYPENGQEVIFVVEAGDVDYAGTVQKGHYHRYQLGDGWVDHEFSFPSRGTGASFWMPCPEPPSALAEGKESGPTMPSREQDARELAGWINVNDQLPEKYQSCLFISKSDDDFYNLRLLGGTYQGNKHGGPSFGTPGLILAAEWWMPYPPLPAEVQAVLEAKGD